MPSQFIKDLQGLKADLAIEQNLHAYRVKVLELLTQLNKDYATDSEIAHALLSSGLSEAEIKAHLMEFERTVQKMLTGVYVHVRLEALECKGNTAQ